MRRTFLPAAAVALGLAAASAGTVPAAQAGVANARAAQQHQQPVAPAAKADQQAPRRRYQAPQRTVAGRRAYPCRTGTHKQNRRRQLAGARRANR